LQNPVGLGNPLTPRHFRHVKDHETTHHDIEWIGRKGNIADAPQLKRDILCGLRGLAPTGFDHLHLT
jgi:hypothetical protein